MTNGFLGKNKRSANGTVNECREFQLAVEMTTETRHSKRKEA
jgi:hypothetical protein